MSRIDKEPPEKEQLPNPIPLDYEGEEWKDGYAGTEAAENDAAGIPDPGPVPIQGKFNHPMGEPEMSVDIGRNLSPDIDEIDPGRVDSLSGDYRVVLVENHLSAEALVVNLASVARSRLQEPWIT